jgi:hypothetical protein
MHQSVKIYLDDTHLLTQFFSMYIIIGCYQLVTNEAIWSWDLIQLLLGNRTLSEPIVEITSNMC